MEDTNIHHKQTKFYFIFLTSNLKIWVGLGPRPIKNCLTLLPVSPFFGTVADKCRRTKCYLLVIRPIIWYRVRYRLKLTTIYKFNYCRGPSPFNGKGILGLCIMGYL